MHLRSLEQNTDVPKKPGNVVMDLEREVVSQLHGIDRFKSWIVRE